MNSKEKANIPSSKRSLSRCFFISSARFLPNLFEFLSLLSFSGNSARDPKETNLNKSDERRQWNLRKLARQTDTVSLVTAISSFVYPYFWFCNWFQFSYLWVYTRTLNAHFQKHGPNCNCYSVRSSSFSLCSFSHLFCSSIFTWSAFLELFFDFFYEISHLLGNLTLNWKIEWSISNPCCTFRKFTFFEHNSNPVADSGLNFQLKDPERNDRCDVGTKTENRTMKFRVAFTLL